MSSGASVTSTTGAKSTVMPRSRIFWPRSSAMSWTCSGVWVWASSRGDGWPSDQRSQPRHPAALFVDADRQRQRCRAAGDLGQRAVGQHRQVGPAADEDAADVVVGDHGTGVVGVRDARPSAAGPACRGSTAWPASPGRRRPVARGMRRPPLAWRRGGPGGVWPL